MDKLNLTEEEIKAEVKKSGWPRGVDCSRVTYPVANKAVSKACWEIEQFLKDYENKDSTAFCQIYGVYKRDTASYTLQLWVASQGIEGYHS